MIVIPASTVSTRIHDKPLVKVGEKTLVELTYSRANLLRKCHRVLIATQSEQVASLVPSEMTGTARNGTERTYFIIAGRMSRSDDIIINWQIDEPFVPVHEVQQAVDFLESDQGKQFEMATLVCDMPPWKEHEDSSVKCAVDRSRAVWFSRSPLLGAKEHIGIYIFRKQVLKRCAGLTGSSQPAKAEHLEQLDWICDGVRMLAWDIGAFDHLAINTHSDLAKARTRMTKSPPPMLGRSS